MKINIIGSGAWCYGPEEGEICWGFNTQINSKHFNVLFDMHDVAAKLGRPGTDLWSMTNHEYLELVSAMEICEQHDIPVFTLGAIEGTSYMAYPIEEIRKEFSLGSFTGDYFTAGFSYALALAIYQRATEIDIWGCTGDDEYEDQRPSAEFWLGVAVGRGIPIAIRDKSQLLKIDCLYGYNTKQGG
jgi:hypothetical protein